MTDADLVSKVVGNGSGSTDFTSTISRSVDQPRAEQPPTHRNQTADVGGMETRDPGPNPLTKAPGTSGLAGVVRGNSIPFRPMWQM